VRRYDDRADAQHRSSISAFQSAILHTRIRVRFSADTAEMISLSTSTARRCQGASDFLGLLSPLLSAQNGCGVDLCAVVSFCIDIACDVTLDVPV
jgi:hypothetical protein